jgi:AraC-like DNA-binding protein
VEEIAARLGYQDTRNFSRSFRRWHGSTPSAVRRLQGG